MTRLSIAVLAAIVAFTTACSGSGGDSVLTVELPTWTLSAEPITELADDGSAARMFTRILPARLPNGDLLAGDPGSKELRIFRDGALLTRLSRQGDGPGELQSLSRIALVHDTIFVLPVPPMSREVSSYTSSNGFLARFRLRGPQGTPGVVPVGVLTTGEFLVEEGRGFRAFNEPPPMGVLIPDSVTVGLLRRVDGDSAGTYAPIGRFHRGSMVPHPVEGPMPFSMAQFTIAPVTAWVASGPFLWIADAATGVLRAFDGHGTQALADTLPLLARPFDPAALQRAREAELARAGDDIQRAAVAAVYDPALRPATMPLFDALVAGHDGEVWIRVYAVEPGAAREFLVVNRSGESIARVSVPAEVTIHQIGGDFLLGVRRDADGVESVVEYRLTR